MLTEKSFQTGELFINYAEGETSKPPFVMLHGSTVNWQTFGEFIPTLEQNWHIYACDLRGHGRSERAKSGYGIADFVPDTVNFIEQVIGQPTVLLGYSMGALIALGVAAQRPELVRALILLEPGLQFRNSSIMGHEISSWLTWVAETLRSTHTFEEVVARCKEHTPDAEGQATLNMAKMIQSIDPESVEYLLNDRVFEHFDLDQILPQVVCPTLLIRGNPELGGVIRDSDVKLLETCLPQSKTFQILDIGHDIIWGPPGKITLRHINQFLRLL